MLKTVHTQKILKTFFDPFIHFQEHRPSHLIKKNFIQTRNRKNKKVQGMCDEEQNVGDVDLNNVPSTEYNANCILNKSIL